MDIRVKVTHDEIKALVVEHVLTIFPSFKEAIGVTKEIFINSCNYGSWEVNIQDKTEDETDGNDNNG